MQIALRHLQECFYMQSSEMMLAYKILTSIQTQFKLKTTLILFFVNPCLSVNFGVMQETFSLVGIFAKRIARHNRCIPGQVVT